MIGETRFDLIDRLIAEQQYLSTVERFAQKHEQAKVPLQAKYYRDLIPFNQARQRPAVFFRGGPRPLTQHRVIKKIE